jgi:hypothetical protein
MFCFKAGVLLEEKAFHLKYMKNQNWFGKVTNGILDLAIAGYSFHQH